MWARQTVLGDPLGDTYVRLTPAEWAFVRRLDGSMTLPELRAQHGDLVDDVLDDLHAAHLLAPGRTGPRRRFVLTRQGIEVRAGNATVRFLHDRLLHRLFTPAGAMLFGALIVLGAVLFTRAAPWRGAGFVVDRVAPATAVLVILLFGIAADVCHEFGHALVTVHHGRRLAGFGLGFHWGAPSFYVDVGQAQFLPRGPRALQSAAGVLVDLALAGTAQIVALAVPPGLTTSALHLITALAYLDVLVNLLPVLGLDGYWILADLLDRPTLREEAADAARDVLRNPRPLAAYALLSWTIGLAMIASSTALWWNLFGGVNVALWHGGLAHRALAVWMLLPQAGTALHLLGLAALGLLRRLPMASTVGSTP